MPIVIWQRAIPSKNEVLSLEKYIQVQWVVAHNLSHMIQSIILQEGIDEQHVSLEIKGIQRLDFAKKEGKKK